MAATIAKCIGVDLPGRSALSQGRMKEAHRLGTDHSIAQANTWRTFSECVVWADGHGYVEVKRDDKVIHRFEFPAESEGPLVLKSTRRR